MSATRKLVALQALCALRTVERAHGRTIALANGVFDLLHVGHLRYLEAAAREADRLVVALNDDASASRLKGPGRPVVPADERAELVAGLGCVDWVVLFAEPTAEAVLRALIPDVHCKGTDHTPESVPEASVDRELGVRLAIVGDPKRHATSALVARLAGPRAERR